MEILNGETKRCCRDASEIQNILFISTGHCVCGSSTDLTLGVLFAFGSVYLDAGVLHYLIDLLVSLDKLRILSNFSSDKQPFVSPIWLKAYMPTRIYLHNTLCIIISNSRIKDCFLRQSICQMHFN